MTNSKASTKRKKIDILLINSDSKISERFTEIAANFRFTFEEFKNSSEYVENIHKFTKPAIVFLNEVIDVNRMSSVLPKANLIFLKEKTFSPEEMQFLRKQGLFAALSHHEIFNTPKLEFLCLQKNRGVYYPISHLDIFASTEMTFNAALKLKLNQRFLPVIFRGFMLSEKKFKRIQSEGQLFVKAQDVFEYLEYIEKYNDDQGTGLKKRCKALFLCLCYDFMSLYEFIIFDSDSDRTVARNVVYRRLIRTVKQLAELIAKSEKVDLWDVFKEAMNNELFNCWRSPWHAVYAGLVCHETKSGDIVNAMLTACFADVGLMDVTPAVFFDFTTKGDAESFKKQEISKHPILSLNRCMAKTLPLPDEVKAALVATHERADGKGFPNQTPADALPFEVWAVQFAELIDIGVRNNILDPEKAFKQIRQEVWQASVQPEGHFPTDVIKKFDTIVNPTA